MKQTKHLVLYQNWPNYPPNIDCPKLDPQMKDTSTVYSTDSLKKPGGGCPGGTFFILSTNDINILWAEYSGP